MEASADTVKKKQKLSGPSENLVIYTAKGKLASKLQAHF
jgi:hypothetical protein